MCIHTCTHMCMHRHEHTHMHAHRHVNLELDPVFSVGELSLLMRLVSCWEKIRETPELSTCCVLFFSEGNYSQERLIVVQRWSLTSCLTSESTSFHYPSSIYHLWTTLGGLGLLQALAQPLKPTKPLFVSIGHTRSK